MASDERFSLILWYFFRFQTSKGNKKSRVFQFQYSWEMERKYLGLTSEKGGFILTNLETLEAAIKAYKKRFEMETMFRNFKSGGYNLEDTNVTGQRLIVMILLIAIAYTSTTMQGQKIKRLGVHKYVDRIKEFGRIERRRSSFYIGLYELEPD